jgi:hypothetical protein
MSSELGELKDLGKAVEAFTNSNYAGKVFTARAEINGKTLEFSSKIKPVYTLENELGCITIEFENGCKVDLSPDEYVFSEDGINGKYFSIGPRKAVYSINDLLGKKAVDNLNCGKNMKPDIAVQLSLEDAVINFRASPNQTLEDETSGRKQINFSNGCTLLIPDKDFEAIRASGETDDYALTITNFLAKKY